VTTPIAVLLSGRGSNFLALQGAVAAGRLPARIVRVVSDVDGAPGLLKARALGVAAVAIPRAAEPSRADHERKLLAELASAGAEWVCLAGYMRLLSPAFVSRFPRRLINIHPSLLPSFPGLHAQRQALAAGVKVSGCTVHFVDEGLDSGPIVAQRAVEVLDGDAEAALAARILEQEHELYPAALRRLITESWRIEGRRVVFAP